jgi:CubicO group peptidase (beta-lactamase class C family)
MKSLASLLLCLLLCATLTVGCSRYFARANAQSNLGISVYEEENVTGLMAGFPVPPQKRVELDNWLKTPFNRWSFQHVSELLPTAQISRGTGPIARLKRMPIVLSVLTFEGADGNPMTVYDMLRSTYTDGFIVLRKGKIISEQYFNGMRPDTKHLTASLSEALIGALAGMAAKRGRLQPETAVVEYVPELRASAFGDATVQQVLDMQVALPSTQGLPAILELWREQEAAAGWRKSPPGKPDGTYLFLKSLPKKGNHGEAFRYASANADALGWIVERTVKTHLPDALSRDIWSKLGAEHDAYVTLDRLGTAFAAAGICATLRDMARFGQMVLQDGFYNSRQIMPAEWIAGFRSASDGPAVPSAPWIKAYPDGHYRSHWHTTGNDHGAYFSIGIYGQHLWIDPKAKVVIVKFSSAPQPFDEKRTLNTFRGFEAIADALMKH